jgi:hypothetical protein
MFGEGQYSCSGAAIGILLLTYAGKALLQLDGLHEVAPLTKGTGVPAEFYPVAYPVAISDESIVVLGSGQRPRRD